MLLSLVIYFKPSIYTGGGGGVAGWRLEGHTHEATLRFSWMWTPTLTSLLLRQSLRCGSSLCSNYSRDYFKIGLA